jgi:hypothetical protein
MTAGGDNTVRGERGDGGWRAGVYQPRLGAGRWARTLTAPAAWGNARHDAGCRVVWEGGGTAST